MLLGPIFHVEMVSVARRRRYFLLRVVYGLFALLLLWGAYTSLRVYASSGPGGSSGTREVSIRQGAQLATGFFLSFSWLQTLAILVVGPALAVGTIASERERRTIEYLFTTDLSNAEIVLGKLAARLCLMGQLLLVGLPILFLFRLMGGIPAQLLIVTFLFAGSTALMIGALSMCVSVWSERARDATARIYLLLAVLLFLPLVFSVAGIRGAFWRTWGEPVVGFCLQINPIYNLGKVIGNQNAIGSRLDMGEVWRTVGSQGLVSLGALMLATFAVRRVHLKETTKAAKREASRRRAWRLPRWRRALGGDAMFWKEVFAGTAGTRLGMVGSGAVVLILLTVCGFTLYGLLETLTRGDRRGFFEYLYGLNATVGTGILLLLASRAAGLVTSERERDCWLSLVSTPLTGSEIIRGKLWGNLYSVRWGLAVLVAHWGLGVFLDPSFVLAAMASLGTFLLLAWYVSVLGLRFSLGSLTTLRAMGATLGTLIFTGGGYLFCCCVVMAGGGSGGDEGLMLMFAPCIPFQLLFPGMAFSEGSRSVSNSVGNVMAIAYGLGTVGYLLAGAGIYWSMVRGFDRLAGRTEGGPEKLVG